MDEQYLQISFHTGPGGNKTGIGNYYRILDSAKIPAGQKAVDEYGPCFELANLARTSGVPHVIVFRLTTAGQNDGFDYDTPQYGSAPDVAARIHWQATIAKLPPEFDKELVWLEVINEPDQDRGDWVGSFCYEIGLLALQDGYKFAAAGWSTGTPYYDTWFTEGWVKFLHLAETNSDQIGVALHEYSLNADEIEMGYPYLIGRFDSHLFDAVDEMRIGRPTVLITEFGWTYNDVPDGPDAMQDIAWAADVYAPHKQVKHAHAWYLGAEYGGIADKVQPLIEPVTDLALVYKPPPPDEPPPPDQTLEQFLWTETVAEQETCGIRLNADAAIEREIRAKGLIPVISEIGRQYSGNGQYYVSQAGEDLAHLKPREAFVWQPGVDVWSFTEPDVVSPVLVLEVWPGPIHNVTQYFGENPLKYSQYCDVNNVCLKGHNGWDTSAPMDSPFRAAVGGVVEWVSDQRPSGGSSGYGWHVRIRTGDYLLIYGHMKANPPVSVGQVVTSGTLIGYSGNTGFSTGPHLHFEMRLCPGLPDWPWCTIDCSPYLQPLYKPAAPVGIDMRPYFRPVEAGPGPFFVLQHAAGITEDIQVQVQGEDIYVVKNQQYEHMRITGGYVERKEDTSRGNDTMYTLDDGYGWSRWCPEVWKPGDVFYRKPVVRVMDKQCNVLSEDLVPSWLRFDALHSVWTSPESNASPNGITFANVIELSYAWTTEGDWLERYWIAPNMGPYSEWMNNQGDHSWISEIPLGRSPLERDIIHCLL